MRQGPSIPGRYVHLVGTVPLSSTTAVFETVNDVLGARLRRIPDGETGNRQWWVFGKIGLIADHPMFEADGHDWHPASGTVPTVPPKYRVRAGVSPKDVVIAGLGYAAVACESYAVFRRLRDQGRLPRPARFQVGLPTPLAFAFAFFSLGSQAVAAQAFGRALDRELREILAAIPAEDLAIQWDVCPEIFAWEGRPVYLDDPRPATLDRLGALGDQVPAAVELGYHFCYGDFNHRHSIEPRDAAIMVEMANGIFERIDRPVEWLHMPVPRDRDDLAYFAPFNQLRLPSETMLYLGLIHATDGVDGARRRMAAANKVVTNYGVATECGFGRRPVDTVSALLSLHATVADLP